MTTQQLIEKTKQLIAIPSTEDNPAALEAALRFVESLVAACPDITIECFERNRKPSLLAYRGNRRPSEFDILLNCHLDVIPGSARLFEPYEKNGKLYGRGALDMKGTAVVMADVFCELVNEIPYGLALQVVTDEEVGGYDCAKLQIEKGVRAKFVVAGEYANSPHTIYNAARGLCWTEIAFKGKSAHGGHLWNGTNALLKAGDFAAAVLKRYPTPDKETWTTTASVAGLSTPNDTYNKVPDHAVLKIDFRFTQEDPVFQNRGSIEEFIASIDPDAQLLDLATFEPAVHAEQLNPYVQGLSQALTKVTGRQARYAGRPAASDGRHFVGVNSEIIEFGLFGHGPHSDHESVSLDSFGEYQAILREFLREPVPQKLRQKQRGLELTLELLEQFVSLPTVTEDKLTNQAMLRIVKRFLQARGMYVKDFESGGYGSLLATTRPNTRAPIVLLNAHCDVVPAEISNFALKAKGDKLYGRGVMDMKFAIASFLTLVDELDGKLEDYDFGILITSDEEVGGRNGVEMTVKKHKLRPKAVIVPDGGENWRVEHFAKGVQWVKLEATGIRAHASRPWEGESAVRKLLKAIQEIEAIVPAKPKPEDTLLSVGTIEGGKTANQVPVYASSILDIRYGNIADYETIYPKIQKICRKYGVASSLLTSDPPCVNDPDNQFIKTFTDIVTDVTGKKHHPLYSLAATDGRYFSAAGIPCIIIEPPAGGRHTDKEWLSKKGLQQFNEAIHQYVEKVAFAPLPRKTKAVDAIDSNHVWYATYASGLWKEHFLTSITGGSVHDAVRKYSGCTDKTLPVKDTFLSLPHELFFSDDCSSEEHWAHPHIYANTRENAQAHTIARAYLITKKQFAEIAAQESSRQKIALPFKEAIKNRRATIGSGQGLYDELLYCGEKEGYPVFTLTSPKPIPSQKYSRALLPSYGRMLYRGLSEHRGIDRQAVIAYLLQLQTPQANTFKESDKRAVARKVA